VKPESITTDWPTFNAVLLSRIASAFQKRHKAITYRIGFSCRREFNESESAGIERLNIDAGKLRLSVWSTGEMWFSVCVRALGRNAGWTFNDSFHGDIQNVSAEELVKMFEATLELPFGSDIYKERQKLRTLWARVCPY
jgi:hypothetical protein